MSCRQNSKQLLIVINLKGLTTFMTRETYTILSSRSLWNGRRKLHLRRFNEILEIKKYHNVDKCLQE